MLLSLLLAFSLHLAPAAMLLSLLPAYSMTPMTQQPVIWYISDSTAKQPNHHLII